MKRYTIALTMTSFIYIFAGVILMHQKVLPKTLSTPSQTSMAISLYTPKEETPRAIPMPVAEIPKKVTEPKSKPFVKPKVPLPKAMPKKEVVSSASITPTTSPETHSKEALEPKPIIQNTSKPSQESLHVKQQRYLKEILARINTHKTYPKIAQKGHIEGSVMVEFTISSQGELLSFTILEGKKIFHKSTEEAIQKSFPCPVKETLFATTMTFQVELSYTLH